MHGSSSMNGNRESVTKVLGSDFEFANSVIGATTWSPRQAASSLLSEFRGYPRANRGGTTIELGRRFLDSCGSSWYIDSDHLEGNLPEHTSAMDHPNVLHGAGFAQALPAEPADAEADQAVGQQAPLHEIDGDAHALSSLGNQGMNALVVRWYSR